MKSQKTASFILLESFNVLHSTHIYLLPAVLNISG